MTSVLLVYFVMAAAISVLAIKEDRLQKSFIWQGNNDEDGSRKVLLELQDLTIKFGGVTALNAVNLKIYQGEILALIGPNGAGKSTISSLLLNYYSITDGEITFDDINANDIELEHLRAHMAIVPQEVILFGGTIKENIAYGKLDATDDEIMEAAKKANAFDFIMSFPDKFETQVGDRGIQLSGGQKQRVAIARAITLKDFFNIRPNDTLKLR